MSLNRCSAQVDFGTPRVRLALETSRRNSATVVVDSTQDPVSSEPNIDCTFAGRRVGPCKPKLRATPITKVLGAWTAKTKFRIDQYEREKQERCCSVPSSDPIQSSKDAKQDVHAAKTGMMMRRPKVHFVEVYMSLYAVSCGGDNRSRCRETRQEARSDRSSR